MTGIGLGIKLGRLVRGASGGGGGPVTVFQDLFERADGALGTADTGETWVITSGVWSIAGGKAGSASGSAVATVDIGVSAYTIIGVLGNTTADDQGLLLRYIDSNNLAAVMRRNGNLTIEKRTSAGGFATVATLVTGVSLVAGQALKAVVAADGTITVSIDDVQQGQPHVVTDFLADTHIGMQTGAPAGTAGLWASITATVP